MDEALRERTHHGNRDFPFALYHMRRLPHPRAFALHWHEEVEIIYVQSGELTIRIDNVPFLGHAGDIFIVNSRQIHEMSVGAIHTVYATVLFSLRSLEFPAGDLVTVRYLQPLSEGRLYFPNCVSGLGVHDRMQQKMEQLLSVYHEKFGAYPMRLRILLLDMICDLFDSGCLRFGEGERFSEKHRKILSYIRSRCFEEITLESAAAEFHMVPKYFSRYFRDAFHITFTDYVNRLRLEKALELLRETELPVTEIALAAGFNSCSYFNKRFHAVYGKTPTQYRRGI